jgi:hypothetical protein
MAPDFVPIFNALNKLAQSPSNFIDNIIKARDTAIMCCDHLRGYEKALNILFPIREISQDPIYLTMKEIEFSVLSVKHGLINRLFRFNRHTDTNGCFSTLADAEEMLGSGLGVCLTKVNEQISQMTSLTNSVHVQTSGGFHFSHPVQQPMVQQPMVHLLPVPFPVLQVPPIPPLFPNL